MNFSQRMERILILSAEKWQKEGTSQLEGGQGAQMPFLQLGKWERASEKSRLALLWETRLLPS